MSLLWRSTNACRRHMTSSPVLPPMLTALYRPDTQAIRYRNLGAHHHNSAYSELPYRTTLRVQAHNISQYRHTTSMKFSTTKNEVRSKEDSEDFWKVEADDHEFWEAYVATRPNYSEPFYKIIHQYHSTHSSSHALAHDVGCGAGQVTAELAQHYAHVIASDTDADHLTVARARLTPHFDQSRVSYTHSKAEHLTSHHPQASADLIAAAEAVVLMDRDSGLQSFARILKPGGTLAAWFYGRPTFSDPILFDQAQHILDKIMVLNWTKVIDGSGPKRAWGFKRCADAMDSWLDFLPFSSDTWVDVQRYKWNTHGTLPFFGEAACGYKIEPVSNVVDGEKVIVEKDENFWVNEWDVAAVKEYFRVLFPGFREAVGDNDKEVNALFEQLAAAMGGAGVRRRFTWPCALVLATRK